MSDTFNQTLANEAVLSPILDRNDPIWAEIHDRVLPRLLRRLAKSLSVKYDDDRCENALSSALRTFLRRRSLAGSRLQRIETLAEFGRLLFTIAKRKFINAEIRQGNVLRKNQHGILNSRDDGDQDILHTLMEKESMERFDSLVESRLTLEEREILFLLLRGHTQTHVASHLGVSDRTVRNYWCRILQQLNDLRDDD